MDHVHGSSSGAEAEETATRHRVFLLQVVQPGLAGLMDGSVSTLAPLFAAAFAIHGEDWSPIPFLVGLAASIGAGISMAFAEGLSDDGSLTGRGRPLVRGSVCGAMTAWAGWDIRSRFLIPHIQIAIAVACIVVLIELITIAWVRHRYMETPLATAMVQVVVGGLLVSHWGPHRQRPI